MTLLYKFTISDPLNMVANDSRCLHKTILKSCNDQEEFELNCGGKQWPAFEVQVISKEPYENGFKYDCEVHKIDD